MEALPKLFPTWNDVSYQELIRQKTYFQYARFKPPDYGGMGVDVKFDGDLLLCDVLKQPKEQIHFASRCCALPFMPIKVKDVPTSCTESLKREKDNIKEFCVRLSGLRNKAKKVHFTSKLQTLKESIFQIRETANYSDENCLKVPRTIKQVADQYPKRVIVPAFNVDYAGGNLALSRIHNQSLLHPCSADFNKLCITPLQNGTDSHFKPLLSEQSIVPIENKPILQIEASENEFCAIRLKSSYHLLNINNLKVYSTTTDKGQLYHIASSPYNPEEILSVYDKGVLKLRNMESQNLVWSVGDYVDADPSLLNPTWRCDFGSHPFATLCMNEKYLHIFDLRENSVKELFCLKGPLFGVGEELVSMKLWNKNPYQHFLASTDHFLICDERYPKKAVMLWNHCLEDNPLYCDIANFPNSTKSAVIIGTQSSCKTEAFFIDYSQTNISPISLGPPLELSSPSDCIDSLKLHAFPVSEKLSKQFSHSLCGISIEPYSTETAFTSFQITSAGDIFYQDFRETFSEVQEQSYCVTTGCTLTPPEKILPYLEDYVSQSDENCILADESDKYSRICVNLSSILNIPKKISTSCNLCRLTDVADSTEMIIAGVCPKCNLDTGQSQYFSTAWANASTVIGPASTETSFLDCHMGALSLFTDEYSKRILRVWMDSENENEISCQEASYIQNSMNIDPDNTNIRDISASMLDDLITSNENMSMLANSHASQGVFPDSQAENIQDYSEFIPPSQEVRSLVGETLLTPINRKLRKTKKILSTAGF